MNPPRKKRKLDEHHILALDDDLNGPGELLSRCSSQATCNYTPDETPPRMHKAITSDKVITEPYLGDLDTSGSAIYCLMCEGFFSPQHFGEHRNPLSLTPTSSDMSISTSTVSYLSNASL